MNTPEPMKIQLSTLLGCVAWIMLWLVFNWQLIYWLAASLR